MMFLITLTYLIMLLIDIVFQSGEFYGAESSFLSDLLINTFGAIIGVLGALYLFRWQLRHDKEKENEARAIETNFTILLMQ